MSLLRVEGTKLTLDNAIKIALKLARLLLEHSMGKKRKTRAYDTAAHLESEKDCAFYLQATSEEPGGEPAVVVGYLGNLSRTHGMMQLARKFRMRDGFLRDAVACRQPQFCDGDDRLQAAWAQDAYSAGLSNDNRFLATHSE